MNIITVNKQNISTEHICCAIGDDKKNKSRRETKREWMLHRFEEGLTFKKFDARGKVFIEYMPVETVWKAITGKNYMVINCLWVSGQYKGKGLSTILLNECIKDAQLKNMNGIVTVSSNKIKPFLTDKSFYLKHGFSIIDAAPPYFELLELKFNPQAESPKLTQNTNTEITDNKGFTFVFSNQCPYTEEYVNLLSLICDEKNIPCNIIKLTSYKEAQKLGNPFGTFGLYFENNFITHELMSEKKFCKLIAELKI